MDKKTARFLLMEAALIVLVILLSQVFPYPLSGQKEIDQRMSDLAKVHEYREITKVDLESSIVYILEIDGWYCEKMFDKSLIFGRYIEKPLVMLRSVNQSPELQFVMRDSLRSTLYTINADAKMVLYRQTNNEWQTLAYVLGGGTLVLMGAVFGAGRKKTQKK